MSWGILEPVQVKKKKSKVSFHGTLVGTEVIRNVSQKKSVSTGSVLKELNKDDDFMVVFREFVKYEQMIVDFATDMHQMQYDAVTTKSLH